MPTPTELISTALQLDLITDEQARKLNILKDSYAPIETTLAKCEKEVERLQALADIDEVEDSEILHLVDTAIAASPVLP